MQNDHVLIFTLVEERDLVRILEPRSARLPVSKLEVEQHRDVLLMKLDKMNSFINSDTCREVFLRNYFGDTKNEPCGHCDNCLKGNSNLVNKTFDKQLITDVIELLKNEDESLISIASKLSINQNAAKQILSYLVKENVIEVSREDLNHYSLTEPS
jgi:ATP-dependent DNA helicase RecQ